MIMTKKVSNEGAVKERPAKPKAKSNGKETTHKAEKVKNGKSLETHDSANVKDGSNGSDNKRTIATGVKVSGVNGNVNLKEALHEYFGFENFKDEQQKIIESVMNGEDTFV